MKKKQGIYCQGQKDDVDGYPSLHPIYRLVVAGIVQQKNELIIYIWLEIDTILNNNT